MNHPLKILEHAHRLFLSQVGIIGDPSFLDVCSALEAPRVIMTNVPLEEGFSEDQYFKDILVDRMKKFASALWSIRKSEKMSWVLTQLPHVHDALEEHQQTRGVWHYEDENLIMMMVDYLTPFEERFNKLPTKDYVKKRVFIIEYHLCA